MRKITVTAALAIALSMPMTAYGVDYSSEEAWEAECAGTSVQQEARQNVTYTPTVDAAQFKEKGVVEAYGKKFTYYSEKVLPGDGLKELNANGRTVDSDGYVVDGDGFIAIASPWGKDEIGTVVETPFGLGRVYDVCEDSSYDVYTSW